MFIDDRRAAGPRIQPAPVKGWSTPILFLLSLCLVCFCALFAMDARAQPGGDRPSGAAPLKKIPAEWPPTDSLPWLRRPATVTLAVTDINEIDATTAEYALSLDAGEVWSPWQPITDTYAPISSQLHLTVTLGDLPDDASGTHRVRFRFTDLDRTEESSPDYPLKVDGSPPNTSYALDPALPVAGWYSDTVTVTLLPVDAGPSGISRTQWRRDAGGLWLTGASFVADTTGTYYYRSVDVAGNWEMVRSLAIQIDRQAPTTTLSLASSAAPVEGWYGDAVTATLSAEDDASGGAIISYRLDGGAWTDGAQVTITGGGIHTLDYRARDVAGNRENTRTAEVRIDLDPPTLSAETDKIGAYVQPPVTMTFTAVDAHSGVAEIAYRLLPEGAWVSSASDVVNVTLPVSSLDGPYIYAYRAQDLYGHVSEASTLEIILDATPPICSALLDGPVGDDANYYTGPVTVTLRCEDALSGVGEIHARIDASQWVTQPLDLPGSPVAWSFVLDEEGRRLVTGRASDLAGNLSASIEPLLLRIDTQPPGSPTALSVDPSGWSESNRFTLIWDNPIDYSGVARGYYKLGEPPASHDAFDGYQEVGPEGRLTGIQVEAEGETPIYIWLRDRAGNVDHATAISTTLRYDASGPQTTVQAAGTEGLNGWFVSSVEIQLAAQDALSGVQATYYSLDGAPWAEWEGALTLATEGTHSLECYSVDGAGGIEPAQTHVVRIDLSPPTGALGLDDPYVPRDADAVGVTWEAVDDVSGIAQVVIDTKKGCGPWTRWRTLTQGGPGAAPFEGLEPGYFQFFRARVTDLAGNVSSWPEEAGTLYAYRDALINGGFGSPLGYDWNMGIDSVLPITRVVTTTHTGATSWMAALGPAWYESPDGRPDGLLEGNATLWQRVDLPQSACGAGLVLTYRYRVLTYDVAFGKLTDERDQFLGFAYFDTFELRALDSTERVLVRARPEGNRWDYCGFDDEIMLPEEGQRWREGLWDSGWRLAKHDLSAFPGQQVRLEFSVWNRHDDRFPTWVYLDDVRLEPASSVSGGCVVPLLLSVPARECPEETSLMASQSGSATSQNAAASPKRPSRR